MTTKELRELDAWIKKHSRRYPNEHIESNVFCLRLLGWKNIRSGSKFGPLLTGELNGIGYNCPFIHRDPAAAMEVLKKCGEQDNGGVRLKQRRDKTWIVCKDEDLDPVWATAETLELAICLFANKLFSQNQPTKGTK